jgi:hypothetical protein
VYSPDPSARLEMCTTGACDKLTHRCSPCGTADGSACCPPDAAQATARCIGDPHLECQFDDPIRATSGTCIECGRQGKLPCYWGCDPGLDLRHRLCDVCGGEFQPPCDRGCNKGLGMANGLGRRCGLRGQIPCDIACTPSGCIKECKYPLKIRQGLCDFCGGDGQPSCDSGCDAGLNLIAGLCRRCGGTGEIPCAHGCNPPLKVANGLCRLCGATGQPPCDSGGCLSGLVGVNGQCMPPQPPPPRNCANLGGACVADHVPGTHCCQGSSPPIRCVFGQCRVCVPHGEECAAFGSQLCCSIDDLCVLDQSTEKVVCDITDSP